MSSLTEVIDSVFVAFRRALRVATRVLPDELL